MKKKLLQLAIEMDAEASRTMEMRCESDLNLVRSNTSRAKKSTKNKEITPLHTISPGSARREGF